MTTWILLGVTAIVLVAVIVRLVFGGTEKRHTPALFDPQNNRDGTATDSEESAPLAMAQADADTDGTGESEDLERTSIHSLTASRSTHTLDSVSDYDPLSEQDSRLPDHSGMSESTDSGVNTNRLTSTQRALFSDFRGIVQSSGEDLPPPDPEELPMDEDDLAFGNATPALAQMLPETATRKQKQRQDLLAAGYHSHGSWLNLNSIRFVFSFFALLLVGLGLIVAPPTAEPYLVAALIGAPLVAWALPPLVVSSKAAERRTDIERGLPDALDMLNMGVSQGLTVQSSLRRIGPEIAPAHPALAEELQIVTRQAKVGSLSQALNNFSQRMDSNEVSSFTSLLIQSEATGTSVSRALADYSDSMRSTFRERADSRANAASFKLLFPTVLCLLPSVFMFLLGPAVVSMSDFFGGTASELLESRDDAINSLDQGPRVIPPDQT